MIHATFEGAAAELTRQLDRHRIAALAALTAVGFSASAIRAFGKPFWHDEIFTILIAGLPSVSAIWRAELAGVDFFPPLNDFVTHLLHSVFGVGPIVTRLPAIVSFWGTCLIVFEIVRRRSNAAVALTAFVVPYLTPGFRYSYEARGYSLMLALFAASLFAWSEAARGNRRRLYLPILALSFAAGLWNHYFAVLTAVPLAVGEAVRLAQSRKPDWGMYGAFVAAGLLVLPLVALLRVTAAAQPASWRSAGFVTELTGAYLFLMGSLLARRFLGLAAVLVAWILVRRFMAGRLRLRSIDPHLPSHEIAAGLTCLLIPAGAILLGIAGGAFYFRYALLFIVGLAIVIPLLAWRATADTAVDTVMCLVFAASFAQFTLREVSAASRARSEPMPSVPVLVTRLERADPVPIVVTDIAYLQAWYYAPAEWRTRLWYLADPDATLETIGTGTIDRNLMVLAAYAPINVANYRSFIAGTRRFLVLSRQEGGWLLQRVAGDGGKVALIGQESGVPVYDVSF